MIEPVREADAWHRVAASYAAAMAGLWIDLELTLARLDSLAADGERLLEDRETLPALQYELHCAAELVDRAHPADGGRPRSRGARARRSRRRAS